MYYYVGTHFGSSDHEVFNDWGVGVPGVVMNTWPDQWYHTSEDRPDKLDPTQMKRAVIITAAAAYTIAAADDAMAGRIAAEIVSNASARIGHQLARGLEEMTRADAAAFPAVVQAGPRLRRGLGPERAGHARLDRCSSPRTRPASAVPGRAQGLGDGARDGPSADDGPGHAPAGRGAGAQAGRPPKLSPKPRRRRPRSSPSRCPRSRRADSRATRPPSRRPERPWARPRRTAGRAEHARRSSCSATARTAPWTSRRCSTPSSGRRRPSRRSSPPRSC